MKYNNEIDFENEYTPVVTKRRKKKRLFARIFSSKDASTDYKYEPDFGDDIPVVTNRVKRDNWFTRLFAVKDTKPAIEPKNNIIRPEVMQAIEINNKKMNYIDRYIKLYDFNENKEIANFMKLMNVRADKVRITDELYDYVKDNIQNDNEEEFINKLYEVFQMKKAQKEDKPMGAFGRLQTIVETKEDKPIIIEDKPITKEDKPVLSGEKIEPVIKYVEKVTVPQIDETKPLKIEKIEDSSILNNDEKNFIFENYNHKDLDADIEKYETKLNKLRCKLLDKKFELSVANDNDKSALMNKISEIEEKISKAERKINACKLKTYYFEQECIRVAEEEQNERLREIRKAKEIEEQKKLEAYKKQKEKEDKEYTDFWNNVDTKDLSTLQNYTDEEIKELYAKSKEDTLMGKAAKEMLKKINADLEKRQAARLKVTVKVLRELKELNKQGLTKKGLEQVIATYALNAEAQSEMYRRYNATNHKEYMKSMMQ